MQSTNQKKFIKATNNGSSSEYYSTGSEDESVKAVEIKKQQITQKRKFSKETWRRKNPNIHIPTPKKKQSQR